MCPFESASIRSIVDVDWSWCRIVHFLNWLGQICRLISLLNRGGTESLRLLHQRFAIFTGVSASLYGRNRQKFQSNRSSIINFSIQLIKYMKIIFNVALFRAFESYQHLKRSAIKMRCSAVGFFFAAKKKNVLFITFLVFGLNSSPSIPHPFHLEKSGKNGKQCWAATLVHSFNLGGFIQFRVGCQSSFTRPFQTHENRQKKKKEGRICGCRPSYEREERGVKKKSIYQCTHLFPLCGGFGNVMNEFVIGIGGKSRDRGRMRNVWVFPLNTEEFEKIDPNPIQVLNWSKYRGCYVAHRDGSKCQYSNWSVPPVWNWTRSRNWMGILLAQTEGSLGLIIYSISSFVVLLIHRCLLYRYYLGYLVLWGTTVYLLNYLLIYHCLLTITVY